MFKVVMNSVRLHAHALMMRAEVPVENSATAVLEPLPLIYPSLTLPMIITSYQIRSYYKLIIAYEHMIYTCPHKAMRECK